MSRLRIDLKVLAICLLAGCLSITDNVLSYLLGDASCSCGAAVRDSLTDKRSDTMSRASVNKDHDFGSMSPASSLVTGVYRLTDTVPNVQLTLELLAPLKLVIQRSPATEARLGNEGEAYDPKLSCMTIVSRVWSSAIPSKSGY